MINTTIVGRLTSDPIVNTRTIGENQVKVANFTVAANHGYGERRKTQFFRVALWRGQADFAENWLKKGRIVAVKGATGIRSYIGKNGTPSTVLEFYEDAEVEVEDARSTDAEPAPEPEAVEEPEVDDDLPF